MLQPRAAGVVLRAGGQDRLLRPIHGGKLLLSMSEAVTAGNAEAVWHELHEQLFSFIVRRVRAPEDAEDILQEVMLRIHRHSGDLVHADRIVGWVYRVTSNAIADHYRKPARRELPSGESTAVTRDGADLASAPTEPDPAQLRAELSSCLAPLVARLPETYREAIVLTELEGMTQVQAAHRLGLSVSGMKTRVQRGRLQLKELLLDCCHVELDSRGQVVAYQSRRGSCATCGQR